MPLKIVDINSAQTYLKKERGVLAVYKDEVKIGLIDFDEIAAVILSAENCTISKQLMVKLAQYDIPIVICGHNYHPISINLPYASHHRTTAIQHQQIIASTPLKKRLWQSIISRKIKAQADILSLHRTSQKTKIKQLQRLSNTIKSGDPDNKEAQASRVYWQALMGDTFRRKKNSNDMINSALNYGYAILRAACARALVGSGLNTSFGLHHQNKTNPFCLADDIMELYRPLIDSKVYDMQNELSQVENLIPPLKSNLANILSIDVSYEKQKVNLYHCTQLLALNLTSSFEYQQNNLHLDSLNWL